MIYGMSSRITARCEPLLLAAAGAMLCLSTGCSKAEKEKEPVVSVQVTPAEKGTISQVITAEAVISPLEQAVIAPKITSTITEFHVQRGSQVKKGDVLAVLEHSDLAAAAEASKGDLDQANATYVQTVNAGLPQQIQKVELDAASAKTAFEAAQKVYDSRKDLFAQGAIPRRDLDAAEVALAQARSQSEQAQKQLADLQRIGKEQALKAAQGSRESVEGKYRAAAAQLSYSRILSPIDGVVTDRPLFVGDLATANQPLLTVMNLSRLIGKTHIPQAQAAALRVGDPAEFNVPGLDEPVKGRVTLVSPALDPGSTTIEVWAEARKPNPALKPGMTVSVSMTAKTSKEAMVVPAGALFKNAEGGYYVLLAGTDEKAHQKPVQVGIRTPEQVQVLSGINPGDPVITAGGYAVPDGTQIKVEKPGGEENRAAGEGGKSDAKEKGDAGDPPKPAKGGKASGSAKPGDKEKE
jgi:HlyD family secretion protein